MRRIRSSGPTLASSETRIRRSATFPAASRRRNRARPAVIGACCVLFPAASQGQSPAAGTGADRASARDTVIAIGPQYRERGLPDWLWGRHYRDAWATEIPLPILDLERFAGGLRFADQVVGNETRSLIFEGEDGRTYVFRSIDKDPTLGLPGIVASSPAGAVLRDQVSAEHPLGVLVSQYLEAAVGLPAPEQHAFVMPDDPALGDARETFAGVVGMLAERPGGHSRRDLAFGGFEEVLDGNEIFERISSSHEDRVDARAFLRARLVDLLTGDWDRHRLQWRWGRAPGTAVWTPIPEDHDQAFLRLDGLVPGRAHIFARELVGFDREYPDITGLHFIAREMDRRFLVGLDRPTWDSVTLATQAALTDEVIDAALGRIPDAMLAHDEAFLRSALRRRRDGLPEASRKLYELLSDDVEVHLTDRTDLVHIESLPNGMVEVVATPPDGRVPYFERRFDPTETREVRLHLWGGDDVAVAYGTPEMTITVRIVGGPGDDELRFEAPLDRVRFYDHQGDGRIVGGRRVDRVDRTPYRTWVYSDEQPEKPIDWGTWRVPTADFGLSSDYGLLLGFGFDWYTYGFRRHPHASRIRLRGGVSTQAKLQLELSGDLRQEGTTQYTRFLAAFSTLDVVNFFGFGNDSERPESGTRQGVSQQTLLLEAAGGKEVGRYADLGLGVAFESSSTSADENPFFSDTLTVYGGDTFKQVSFFGNVVLDSRDFTGVTTRGARFDARLSYYPIVFDVENDYVRLDAVGSTYLSARSVAFQPTLALRAGGARVWGEQFPFFNAALVGGSRSLRGFDTERFAGDTSLFGTVELRLLVRRLRASLFADLGLLGFADVGRVWLDGESPGGFRSAVGGGIWAVLLGPENTLSATVAFSEEGSRFYFRFGMPF